MTDIIVGKNALISGSFLIPGAYTRKCIQIYISEPYSVCYNLFRKN